MPRNEYLHIRIESDRKAVFVEAARRAGVDLSDYVLGATERRIRHEYADPLGELLALLQRNPDAPWASGFLDKIVGLYQGESPLENIQLLFSRRDLLEEGKRLEAESRSTSG